MEPARPDRPRPEDESGKGVRQGPGDEVARRGHHNTRTSRMRAAWWWIDRWRQSTAYTDMTAEEQGLYRNLLDEVWLRENCLIPDDPRILARISGDPEAWKRCGEKVLRWMKKVPGGWTNVIALQVIGQSVRRAENQKRYRSRKNNEADNATDNGADNKPDSLSLSQSIRNTSTLVVGREVIAPRRDERPPSLPADIAETAVVQEIRKLQNELGSRLARLAEHPNSRFMVPEWSRRATSYTRKDGTKVPGVADYRTVSSIERLERSIADADRWLKRLEQGPLGVTRGL